MVDDDYDGSLSVSSFSNNIGRAILRAIRIKIVCHHSHEQSSMPSLMIGILEEPTPALEIWPLWSSRILMPRL
jgi:hypothetical protein